LAVKQFPQTAKSFENVEKMTYRVHSFPGVRSVNGKTLTSVDLTGLRPSDIIFNVSSAHARARRMYIGI